MTLGEIFAILCIGGVGYLGYRAAVATEKLRESILMPGNAYFSTQDFLRSNIFPQLKDYKLNAYEKSNLARLIERLTPLAIRYGSPTILSGGRPPSVGDWYTELKKRGFSPAKDSQHGYFSAVDITWGDDYVNKEIWEKAPKMGFLQVIYYPAKEGKPNTSRLHLSISEPRRRIKPLHIVKQ